MFGSPKVFKDSPPKIIVELFDKDTVVGLKCYYYIRDIVLLYSLSSPISHSFSSLSLSVFLLVSFLLSLPLFSLFFFKGKDEFLGIVECTPVIRLTNEDAGARLQWFEVKRYGQYAGDLLAAFELFWVCLLFIIIVYFNSPFLSVSLRTMEMLICLLLHPLLMMAIFLFQVEYGQLCKKLELR